MNIYGLHLPIMGKLNEILTAIIIDYNLSRTAFTVTFRDPHYAADSGGFHPVEICIDERELIQYITDFSYLGSGSYSELVKELDFDFMNMFFSHMGRDYPLRHGAELFKIWQQNFVTYHQEGVYEVEVSIV